MKLLKAIWQLPQYVGGFIVSKILKAEYAYDIGTSKVYYWSRSDGVSLGKYIFVWRNADENYVKHEYGHSKQSLYLGWLYLLVIGIPSAIWSKCFLGYRRKHNVGYYEFYTEKWADKLGGVER